MKKLVERAVYAGLMVGLGTGSMRGQFPKAVVDPALRDNGAKIYASDCAQCHGEDIRGNAKGPDLMRSLVVLHDRREMLHGKELGPVLASGNGHHFRYDAKQLDDLSQFLTASINSILRSGYNAEPTNLLSGDAKAGEAYFNGAGGCNQCHSVTTGEFAKIGAKYRPANLQQKILFPNAGIGLTKKVQVTVKQPSGKTYAGDLVRMDDFTVSLREKTGEYRSLNRTPGTKVTSENPFAAHVELLDKYTDADIHNLLAYLVTLK